MIENRHRSGKEKIKRAFAWIVRLWPAHTQEWAQAMQAELHEIEGLRESLLWLVGGTMALGKAWWSEIWRKRDAAETPAARVPVTAAVLLLLCALAAGAPGVRQGMMTVFDTWHDTWHYRGTELSAGELRSMAQAAEQTGDAETMAFAAMRMSPSAERNRLADRAVAFDPRLTWIYYHMRRPLPPDRAAEDPNAAEKLLQIGRAHV